MLPQMKLTILSQVFDDLTKSELLTEAEKRWLINRIRSAEIVDNSIRLELCETVLAQHYFIQQNSLLNDIAGKYTTFYDEKKWYEESNCRDLRDGNRLLLLKMLLDIANQCEPGSYAELGTHKGLFARIVWLHMDQQAKLYCFDTFEGFDAKDVAIDSQQVDTQFKAGTFADTSLELVINNITQGDDPSRLVLKQGYFPDTFAGMENEKWRFVHLDCDLYEPMLNGLKKFWPNLVPGGVIMIHDYNGGFEGTKKAVDEFFAPLGITPVPLCDKMGSAVVIKNTQ